MFMCLKGGGGRAGGGGGGISNQVVYPVETIRRIDTYTKTHGRKRWIQGKKRIRHRKRYANVCII